MKSIKHPLNQREYTELEWFDKDRLRVTWKDTTVSWFNCTPDMLASHFKHKVSAKLVTEATVAYVEFMLKPKTLEEKLKKRTAFVRLQYEKMDKP